MKAYSYSPDENPVPAGISAYRLILACIILICLSFSAFAGTSATSFIEFKSFTVSREANKIVLSWDVNQQASVDHYVIESSENGTDFSIAGYAFPPESNDLPIKFWFKPKKNSSVKYYRIRSVETNGTLSYSPSRELRVE
ncbi:MAG TPA: hypothetical protein VLC28_08760 [Flavitalea sp.]|nr:hypothetical protein [Flavitalea sp.]